MRKGHVPENLAILRRLALSLLKREQITKRGVQGKRLLAGWNDAQLLKVLGVSMQLPRTPLAGPSRRAPRVGHLT